MSDELKPCPFCGGRAIMKIQKHIPNGYDYTPTCQDPSCAGRLTKKWINEADAIEAWNRRAERTVKVVEHDASITDTDGYKYHRTEYLCGACKKKVLSGDDYCSHCGVKLDWGK